MNRRRAKAGNPPVNSRVTVVLLLFAAICRRLLERVLLQRAQGLAHLPDRASSCCELPRVVARKGQGGSRRVGGCFRRDSSQSRAVSYRRL
jgi:hypothetical protein